MFGRIRQMLRLNKDPRQHELAHMFASAGRISSREAVQQVLQIMAFIQRAGWGRIEAVERVAHALSLVKISDSNVVYENARQVCEFVSERLSAPLAVDQDSPKTQDQSRSPGSFPLSGGYRPFSAPGPPKTSQHGPHERKTPEQQRSSMKEVSEQVLEEVGEAIMGLFEIRSLTVSESMQILTVAIMVMLKRMPPETKEVMKQKVINAVRACS
jgi:hypothetical protein